MVGTERCAESLVISMTFGVTMTVTVGRAQRAEQDPSGEFVTRGEQLRVGDVLVTLSIVAAEACG
jgi:hypothetical protein